LSAEVEARISDVNAEETRAMSAEAVLSSDLSSEVANRESAVSTEASRATAAEGSLASNLSSEVSARIADVDAEESRATAAEGSLATSLSNESSARIADVDAEESRAMAAELVLTNDLSSEASRATAAEGSLASDIATEKGRIDAILAGADVDLDQFVEIVDFVNGIDLENDNALLSAVTSIGSDITAETSSRVSGDASLASDLSTEVSDRGVAIDNEASIRLAADQSLAADLSAEISRAQDAEASLETALSTEVSYLIANTDLTAIDSFAEVSDAVTSVETSVNNLSINTESYVENNRPSMIGFNEAPDGTNATFTANVFQGTEIVFLNGLMQLASEDYTVSYTSPGKGMPVVASVTFTSAPASTDKINVYGVSNDQTFNGIN
jgi:hypothetical protein